MAQKREVGENQLELQTCNLKVSCHAAACRMLRTRSDCTLHGLLVIHGKPTARFYGRTVAGGSNREIATLIDGQRIEQQIGLRGDDRRRREKTEVV